jgi:hypothetical protein
MLPSAITLRNFRSFAGPEGAALELRPLTLLYGLNNGGKSSLLRSLPLLADSLDYDGLDALNVEGRLAEFDLDFDSIRWKGRKETDDHTITVGLRWDDNPTVRELEWELEEERDWHRTVVKRFTIRGTDTSPLLSAVRMPKRDEIDKPALTYDVERSGGARTTMQITFRGLLPELTSSVPDTLMDDVRARLRALSGSVLWLRSLRKPPERITRWRGAVRWSLEPDGHDAPIVLAGEDEVKAEVSSWYRKHLGFDLLVQEAPKREVRTMLQNRARATFDVDLIDTGEGLGQCLPVLTALAMARRHRERGQPSIVAIEEPEAHLHPNLQRALAEQACEVASEARPRIVLETHSEHILLTVRLSVVKAESKLRPEDVIIYWVRQLDDGSSVADRIEIDAEGRFIGNWPPDAFQQDISLAADIRDELDKREAE